MQCETGRLQAEYLPALALARRAALSDRKNGCNLRQGRYAFSGSLAPFRRQLIAIAVLLVLTLVATAAGFWFNYSSKAGELKHLDLALQSVYTQSFPNAPLPVDVPLFMASNLAGLHEKSRLLGTAQIGPLQALESLTDGVGLETGIEVQEFNFNAEGATLSGRTDSFDAVDQLAERLRQKSIFTQVQIGDAKMSVDGSRVDFRVDITFGSAGRNDDDELKPARKAIFVRWGGVLLLLLLLFGLVVPLSETMSGMDSRFVHKQEQLEKARLLQAEVAEVKLQLAQLERKIDGKQDASLFALIENNSEQLGFRDNLVSMRPQSPSRREGFR